VTRHFGLFQSLDAAQVLKALAPRSGVKIAYPLEALAAQAGTSEQRTERVLDVLREHRIVRTRDAAGGVSYELQHDAFIEIVRPWAEQRFRGATSALVVWQAWPCCWR
jgi:DNA-binding IclR family transcriptional regulator